MQAPYRDAAAQGGEAAGVESSLEGPIHKSRTGVAGFDEITGGGLPSGRTTLVLGAPGAGKTVFALECLVNGARDDREPGIFVAFEENTRQIIANAATFGWDLPALERERLFFLDARLSSTVIQGGDFDIQGMLAGLAAKAKSMNAKRIVFDGIDVLLTILNDRGKERREIYRLQDWLHEHGLTAIITGKASEGDRLSTERYAFMQFMVDAVVAFHHRLVDRVSLRGVRVLKYRGSGFAENEFPMIISPTGVQVAVFEPTALEYQVSDERVSSGVPRLDTMLDGGYYRGSGVLISGAPGTAKTTLAGSFIDAACDRGERALYVSFDEASAQIVRNLRSVGLDLQPHIDAGLLDMHSVRTESRSAEEHFLALRERIRECEPRSLVIDPISALNKTGGLVAAVHGSLRLLDYARANGITVLCTSLVASENAFAETTQTQISTIADTWIHLAYLVHAGERNRTLTIVKSRGMAHSNQVRELVLSSAGVTLTDVYTAGGEVLVGTARWEHEARQREEEAKRHADVTARRAALERELASLRDEEARSSGRRSSDRRDIRRLRHADPDPVDVA
ncbi:MAG TPA: circadian clock protein KaiC [Gemmatimonadaceae bacterium]|nr:circadian clock protein KaiC [Gemmatimonadaceae bacterium]